MSVPARRSPARTAHAAQPHRAPRVFLTSPRQSPVNRSARTPRPRIIAATLPRTAKIWERFHVGMQVTVRERVEAYYSRYAGNPVCFLEPGMVGVIAAVDVPYVRRSRGKSETFACVDFTHTVSARGGDTKWRAGVDPKNLVPLTDPKRRYVRPADAVRVIACPGGSGWTGYTAADKAVLTFVANASVGIFGGAAALERTRAALTAAGYALEVIAS